MNLGLPDTLSDQNMSDLPPDVWEKLNNNDSDAWHDLLHHLLPGAVAILREGFDLPAQEDAENHEAALISAWPSFQRHFLAEQEQRFEDATDMATLASHFVRITYNRSQRKKRRQKKLLQNQLFDASDGAMRPDENLARSDFLAYFRSVVDQEVEGLKTDQLRYQVVRQWLASELNATQAEIARAVGVNQSTVHRYLGEFKERVKRRIVERDAW